MQELLVNARHVVSQLSKLLQVMEVCESRERYRKYNEGQWITISKQPLYKQHEKNINRYKYMKNMGNIIGIIASTWFGEQQGKTLVETRI